MCLPIYKNVTVSEKMETEFPNKPEPFLYCPFKQGMIVVIVYSRLVHLDNQITRIYSRRGNRFDALHENNGYSCLRVVTSSYNHAQKQLKHSPKKTCFNRTICGFVPRLCLQRFFRHKTAVNRKHC